MRHEGKLKEEFKQYSLHTLMKRCSDFANKKLALEHLFLQLSRKEEPTISMLTSPKYHCEVAVESIEFVWGMLKCCFCSIPLKEKDTKQKFNKCVREGMESYIKKENVINFAGLCFCYMMVYQKYANSNNKTLTFNGIERYMKQMKTHCNVSDIEKDLIKRDYTKMVVLKK